MNETLMPARRIRRDRLDDLVGFGRSDLDPGGFRVVVNEHGRARNGFSDRFVMRIDFPIIVRIVVGRHDTYGIDAEAHGMLGEFDGRKRVRRADVHHDRHAAAHALDDLLGDFLALVDFHHHALAVGAQGKKAMHAGVQIEIDDRVGRGVIDGAVLFERHRHGHQNAFNFFVARHRLSFRKRELARLSRIHSATGG